MSKFIIKHIILCFTSQASFSLCLIKTVTVSYSYTYRSGLIPKPKSTGFPRFPKKPPHHAFHRRQGWNSQLQRIAQSKTESSINHPIQENIDASTTKEDQIKVKIMSYLPFKFGIICSKNIKVKVTNSFKNQTQTYFFTYLYFSDFSSLCGVSLLLPLLENASKLPQIQ